MTWNLVQNPTPATGSGTSVSKAFGSNVTAGNTLVAAATVDANTTCTFSSTGDTWTTIKTFFETAAGQLIAIGVAVNVTGGAKTVTATFGATGNFDGIIIAEWSGGPTSLTQDGGTAGQHLTSSTTPTDSPGFTTTVNGDLILSVLILDTLGTTPSAGGGLTFLGNDANGLCFEAGQQNTAGTITPSFSLTTGAATGIISGSVQAGGTPAPVRGQTSTNRHPGRGPGKARFFQAPRSTFAGNTVNIDGALVVTATSSAADAITHVVGGSLTVTANRSSATAITHTIGGTRSITVNRTAADAITHTVGGSLAVTVNRTAADAITHTVGGSLVVTVGRTSAIAVTHTVGGALVVTVNRTGSIITGKDISGSRPVTVSLTAAVAVVHRVSGSLIIVVTPNGNIVIPAAGATGALFLPFF